MFSISLRALPNFSQQPFNSAGEKVGLGMTESALFSSNFMEMITTEVLLPDIKDRIHKSKVVTLEQWQEAHFIAHTPKEGSFLRRPSIVPLEEQPPPPPQFQSVNFLAMPWSLKEQRDVLSNDPASIRDQIQRLERKREGEPDTRHKYVYTIRLCFLYHTLDSLESHSENNTIMGLSKEMASVQAYGVLANPNPNFWDDYAEKNICEKIKAMYYKFNSFEERDNFGDEGPHNQYLFGKTRSDIAVNMLELFLRMFEINAGVQFLRKGEKGRFSYKSTFPSMDIKHEVRGGEVGRKQSYDYIDEKQAASEVNAMLRDSPATNVNVHADDRLNDGNNTAFFLIFYLDDASITEFLNPQDLKSRKECLRLAEDRQYAMDPCLDLKKETFLEDQAQLRLKIDDKAKARAKPGSMVMFSPRLCHKRPDVERASEARIDFYGEIKNEPLFEDFCQIHATDGMLVDLFDRNREEQMNKKGKRELGEVRAIHL